MHHRAVPRPTLALPLLALLGCRAPAPPPAEHGASPAEVPPAREADTEAGSPAETPAGPPAPPEASLGLADRGIWADLDPRVRLARPTALTGPRSLVIDRAHGIATLYSAAWPVKAYPIGGDAELGRGAIAVRLRPGDAAELDPIVGPEDLRELPPGAIPAPGDADDDGIVDPLDVLLGAHKTDLNDARYDPAYVVIPSPNGDVPREQGVCTDVIVRALRNAGVDLQSEVNRDIARAPKAYPMVEKANDDIDHRRVRTILPWFQRHWTSLGIDPDDAGDPYRPGDVILMDTIPSRDGPDHIGIVSDARGEDGRLLVVNNWDTGHVTDSLSLIGAIDVTHRFRMPAAPAAPIPDSATRLVAVEAASWDTHRATLRRFERSGPGAPWTERQPSVPVVLGASGLAWGQGLHGSGRPDGRPGETKREGDMRSPAGVFALGRMMGAPDAVDVAPGRVETVGERWRCVDDPSSRHYGRVVDADIVTKDWTSAEKMRIGAYRLAVTIEHNTMPSRPGAGSCIFLHQWRDADTPVSGCTAMAGDVLDELVAWIEPGRTVVVALPRAEWSALRRDWALP